MRGSPKDKKRATRSWQKGFFRGVDETARGAPPWLLGHEQQWLRNSNQWLIEKFSPAMLALGLTNKVLHNIEMSRDGNTSPASWVRQLQ